MALGEDPGRLLDIVMGGKPHPPGACGPEMGPRTGQPDETCCEAREEGAR